MKKDIVEMKNLTDCIYQALTLIDVMQKIN